MIRPDGQVNKGNSVFEQLFVFRLKEMAEQDLIEKDMIDKSRIEKDNGISYLFLGPHLSSGKVSGLRNLLFAISRDFDPQLRNQVLSLDHWAIKLGGNSHFLLAINDSDEIEGLICFYQKQPSAFISLLWVKNEKRGSGLSREMLKLLATRLARIGISSILLESHVRNKATARFYKKSRFTIVKERQGRFLWHGKTGVLRRVRITNRFPYGVQRISS